MPQSLQHSSQWPRKRRLLSRRLWRAFVSVLLVTLLSSGFQLLHFVLVPHRWCPTHGQFEDITSPVADSSQTQQRAARTEQSQARPSPEAAPSEEHRSCAVLGCPHQRMLSAPGPSMLSQLGFSSVSWRGPPPQLLLPDQSLDCAPKRSPPSV